MYRHLIPLASALLAVSSLNADQDLFHMMVVNQTVEQPWLKSVGDINKDGRDDLIIGAAKSGGLFVMINRFPHWRTEVVDAEQAFSTDGEVADVNGDGTNDIVAITKDPDGLRLYTRSGNRWSRRQEISNQALHDIEIADFDGDGQLDIVGRNQKEWPKDNDAGDKLHLFWQSRSGGGISWTSTTVPCPAGEGLLVHDVDGDGDPDIILNGFWLENTGNRAWESRRFAAESDWNHPNTFIAAGDINGDGRSDIVLVPSELEGQSYRVSWFEAPRKATSGTWKAHVIVEETEAVLHSAALADFDQDGDLDLLTAEMPQSADPDEVMVFFNRMEAEESKGRVIWEKAVVSNEGSHSMRVLDVDGDGYPEFFGANWSAKGQDEKVKVWVNRIPAIRAKEAATIKLFD